MNIEKGADGIFYHFLTFSINLKSDCSIIYYLLLADVIKAAHT